MKAEQKISREDCARRLRRLEERALKFGWKIRYSAEEYIVEGEVRALELEMLAQEERVVRIRTRFGRVPPQWIIDRICFPLTEDWFDRIEASIQLDAGWRRQFIARKQAIHPSYHDSLPDLPPLIDEQSLIPILQSYETIEKKWNNRLYKLLRSLSKPKNTL